jgi:hypothetical protein
VTPDGQWLYAIHQLSAGIYLAPHIARLSESDSRVRFVSHIIRYALEVEAGAIPGEPPRDLPGRAECFVRAQLMPREWFEALRDLPVSQLAEIFHVPPEQVIQRRLETTKQSEV